MSSKPCWKSPRSPISNCATTSGAASSCLAKIANYSRSTAAVSSVGVNAGLGCWGRRCSKACANANSCASCQRFPMSDIPTGNPSTCPAGKLTPGLPDKAANDELLSVKRSPSTLSKGQAGALVGAITAARLNLLNACSKASSTSPRPACILMTFESCWRRSMRWSKTVIQSSWLNTIWM